MPCCGARKSRKKLAEDFISDTSFHGLGDLCGAENRCFVGVWVLAILLSMAGAAYEIRQVVKAYIDSPIVTEYSIEPSSRLQFPVVQICPSHFINKTKAMTMKREHPSVVDQAKFAVNANWQPFKLFQNVTAALAGKDELTNLMDQMTVGSEVAQETTLLGAMSRIAQTTYYVNKDTRPDLARDSGVIEGLFKYGNYMGRLRAKELQCYNRKHTSGTQNSCPETYGKARIATPIPSTNPMYSAVAFNFIGPAQIIIPGTTQEVLDKTHNDLTEKNITVRDNTDPQEFFQSLRLDTEKVLAYCSWRGRYERCSDMARPNYDTRYGQCFTFDLKQEEMEQLRPGHGLVLTEHSHGDQSEGADHTWAERPDERREVQWTHRPDIADGVAVRLLTNGISPAPPADLWVSEGTATKMAISSTHYELFESDSLKLCVIDMPRKVFASHIPYSDGLCRQECIYRAVVADCECLMGFAREHLVEGVLPCSTNVGRYCQLELLDSESFLRTERACLETCRPACKHWDHEAVVSRLRFPNKAFEDYINQSDSRFASTLSNHIVLSIAYENMHLTKIRQRPRTTIDGFIASIGGHLGLFLGSSMLSIFQLIVFIIRYICCAKNAKVGDGEELTADEAAIVAKAREEQRWSASFVPPLYHP